MTTLEFLQYRRYTKNIKVKQKVRMSNYEVQEHNKIQRVLRQNPFVQY